MRVHGWYLIKALNQLTSSYIMLIIFKFLVQEHDMCTSWWGEVALNANLAGYFVINTDSLTFEVNMVSRVNNLHPVVCCAMLYFHISPMAVLHLYSVVPTSSNLPVFPIHFFLLSHGFCICRRKYVDTRIIMSASLWAEIWTCGIPYEEECQSLDHDVQFLCVM